MQGQSSPYLSSIQLIDGMHQSKLSKSCLVQDTHNEISTADPHHALVLIPPKASRHFGFAAIHSHLGQSASELLENSGDYLCMCTYHSKQGGVELVGGGYLIYLSLNWVCIPNDNFFPRRSRTTLAFFSSKEIEKKIS